MYLPSKDLDGTKPSDLLSSVLENLDVSKVNPENSMMETQPNENQPGENEVAILHQNISVSTSQA